MHLFMLLLQAPLTVGMHLTDSAPAQLQQVTIGTL